MGINSHTRDFAGLKFEVDLNWTRSVRLLKAHAEPIEAMTILGVEKYGATTVEVTNVAGANKGAVALSGDGYGAGVKVGRYVLECIEPYDADGPVPAVFGVTDPDGVALPALVAGVEYEHGGLHLTKAIGTADAAGDQAFLDVEQAEGSGKYVPLNPDATDGSDEPAGILPERTLASASDEAVLVVDDGPTVIANTFLVYGTADQTKISAIDAALRRNCNIKVIAGAIV